MALKIVTVVASHFVALKDLVPPKFNTMQGLDLDTDVVLIVEDHTQEVSVGESMLSQHPT